MKIIVILSLLLSINPFSILAQSKPDSAYHAPLGIPLILASNFGELRPNHFHMGLDFKTNSRIGYNLYSIKEGFVSRIKVSPFGYGKVVYIDHPNGITSVYAHCSEFKGEIDSIVKATQFKEQNFEVEIFPGDNVIKVKRGEIIALSGNTGGSTAPHLHFEIRDTKTEHALNPLVYGFDIADSKKPQIRGLKVYAITKDGYRFPNKEKAKIVTKGKYGYYIGADQIVVPSSYCSKTGGIGFAFDVIDKLDGAPNQCGLYGSYLIVDGDTIFGQETNRVPFESTRYVNSHRDYESYIKLRKKYHKSFRTNVNDLPIYENGVYQNGVIKANPGDTLDIHYVAYDVAGNESEVEFQLIILQGVINNLDSVSVGDDFLHPTETYTYETESTILEFGYASVYEPVQLNKQNLDHQILNSKIPVNRKYRIKERTTIDDEKYYIEITTNSGKRRAIQVSYKDGWAYADSKYFGKYSLKRDTISPSVYPINFSNSTTIISKKLMIWKISDKHSGIADYDLFIDGKWYLLEYETKGGPHVTYTRNSNLVGEKEVTLRLTDNCGNVKEWKKTILFK